MMSKSEHAKACADEYLQRRSIMGASQLSFYMGGREYVVKDSVEARIFLYNQTHGTDLTEADVKTFLVMG